MPQAVFNLRNTKIAAAELGGGLLTMNI